MLAEQIYSNPIELDIAQFLANTLTLREDVHPTFRNKKNIIWALHKYEGPHAPNQLPTLEQIYATYSRNSDQNDIQMYFSPFGRYIGRYGILSVPIATRTAHKYMVNKQQFESFREGYIREAARVNTSIWRVRGVPVESPLLEPFRQKQNYTHDEVLDLYDATRELISQQFDEYSQEYSSHYLRTIHII